MIRSNVRVHLSSVLPDRLSCPACGALATSCDTRAAGAPAVERVWVCTACRTEVVSVALHGVAERVAKGVGHATRKGAGKGSVNGHRAAPRRVTPDR